METQKPKAEIIDLQEYRDSHPTVERPLGELATGQLILAAHRFQTPKVTEIPRPPAA